MNTKLLEWLAKNLAKAGIKSSPQSYLGNAAKYSVLAFTATLLLWMLLSEELAAGMLCAAAASAATIALFLYLPIMKKRRTAELIEKELPLALMSASVLLNINLPFEKAIERIADEDYGLLSIEFRRIAGEVKESGASIQEALFNFSERIDSLNVKRSVSQLVSIYEQGSRRLAGEPVKRIALEQLAQQRAAAKEFSGKLVVFSLMFIAVSAIMPALFLAFIVVGSMFMELDFAPLQVLVIANICFPLLDLAILFYIKNRTPAFLR